MKPPAFTLIAVCLALHAWTEPGWAAALEYDRAAIAAGELWRLVTGHACHFTPQHLLWDTVLFAALSAWVETRSRRAWLAVFLGSSLAISLSLWFFVPTLVRYRGLSGVDSAFFAWIAYDVARLGWRSRRWSATCAGGSAVAGLLAKATYESVSGATLFVASSTSFVPVPAAHLVGGAAGLWVAWRFARGQSRSACQFEEESTASCEREVERVL